MLVAMMMVVIDNLMMIVVDNDASMVLFDDGCNDDGGWLYWISQEYKPDLWDSQLCYSHPCNYL